MILGERRSSASEAAFEGRATLDQILKRLATSKADQFAVSDPSDRPAFTDGSPRRLTWAQLNAQADLLARCLTGLGLERDSVVAVQLSNTVESIIALLGIMRAGMIAALMPLAWRQQEVSWALGRTGAKAAITMVRAGPVAHAGVVSRAALDNFGLRFICAFGRGAPDGVLALDEAFKDDSWPELGPETREGNPGDQVAVITFDATANGFVPIPRTHNGLIVAGLAHLVETRIEAGDAIATTLPISSIAGLATGLMTSLLSGARLFLHQSFNAQVFIGSIATVKATHAVLPGIVADSLGNSRLPYPPLRGMTAVRRDPCEVPVSTLAALNRTEIVSYGEIGLVARGSGEAVGSLSAGLVPVSRAAPEGMVLAETRLGPDGSLTLRGPVAPAGEFPGRQKTDAALPIDPDGYVDSGWKARSDGERLLISTGRKGVALIGGLSLPAAPTLAAVGEALALEEAPSFTSDRMFGKRLAVTGTAPSDIAQSLRDAGFTPALGLTSEEAEAESAPEREAEVA